MEEARNHLPDVERDDVLIGEAVHAAVTASQSFAASFVLPRGRALVLAGVVVATVIGAGVALVLFVLSAVRDDPAPAASTSPAAAVGRVLDGRDFYVGTDLDAGVYVQAAATPACAWRVSDPITDETLVEGRPGTGPATVNLGPDVKFRADGCGPWIRR